MNFLVIVLLFVVFLQTRIMDLRRAIICLSVQSAVIALACFISGIAHGEGIHIYAPGLLTIIVNIMNLLGTSSLAQPMVVGAVILLMVLMDTFKQSRGEKFKKKAVEKTQ